MNLASISTETAFFGDGAQEADLGFEQLVDEMFGGSNDALDVLEFDAQDIFSDGPSTSGSGAGDGREGQVGAIDVSSLAVSAVWRCFPGAGCEMGTCTCVPPPNQNDEDVWELVGDVVSAHIISLVVRFALFPFCYQPADLRFLNPRALAGEAKWRVCSRKSSCTFAWRVAAEGQHVTPAHHRAQGRRSFARPSCARPSGTTPRRVGEPPACAPSTLL